MEYPLINEAIKEIPRFKEYILIIEHKSITLEQDLKSLEYLLVIHTAEQVYEFLPRFISLL